MKRLIILIIVMAVALCGVVVVTPWIVEQQTTVTYRKVFTDNRILASAIERYRVSYGTYPPYAIESVNGDNAKGGAILHPFSQHAFNDLRGIDYNSKGQVRDRFSAHAESMRYFSNGKGWIIWSIGPDHTNDIDIEDLKEYPLRISVVPIEIYQQKYDPTNGIVSAGDIFRLCDIE